MSGRLSRKRRAPPTPEAAPAALDITDDFSDEPVHFRAPKKTRTDTRDHFSKATSEPLCKSVSRKTSTKSIHALEADVTDKEKGSMKKNSSTNHTGKQTEVLVLTLDDDDDDNNNDDDEEKQEDESDDNESPFPALNSPERARSSSSTRVTSRKALDAAALAQTISKSSFLESTSAPTTSSYFSAALAGPNINLSNRRPSKFHKGGAQGARCTAPDQRIYQTKTQHVPSLDNHKAPQASNILSANAAKTIGLPSAANTEDQRNVVHSEDESNKAADNGSSPTKLGNSKNKLVGAADKVAVQVVDSDRDDYSCLAPSVCQDRHATTVPDDEEEEEYNLDTLCVDPFLIELEKSVCSEQEKLCPCCKNIVLATRYGTHLRLCFGKYQYSIRGSSEDDASGGRRRGRSAAVNQTKKSAAEENASTRDGEAERVGCQSLVLADGADDFKEQENKSNVGLSTNDVRRKVKSSRYGRTKSRSRLDCKEEKEQQHEPIGGRQPTKDHTHDGGMVERLHEANKPEKKKVRQERLFGDRQPSSEGGGVVRSHQPLLSVAAGVLQVIQRSESAASVLDPAEALMAEPSCMVRIKRGRDLVSSASGAPPPGPGVSRGRRLRGKKGLPVTSLMSTEQRSVALAERLAAVLLSGKPSEAEPWESVRRGRTTAVGARLSGAVTKAISADQPLWQLCRSDRGDIQQYYVPELAPHVVPPVRGDSLNITMHRHLSQIPGRLNITQSLGLPVGAFSDDEEEEPYGREDRSSSVLYGSLSTTQLALVRLLGSQADEILNWSIRSSFNSGGEPKLQGTRGCQKKSTVESRDAMDKDNNRDDKDGESCGDVVESGSDTLHRSDHSGEEIERRKSDCLTSQCGDVSRLCDEVESGSDTKMNQNDIHSKMASNNPISWKDVSLLATVNSSKKCIVASEREFPTNTSCNERSISVEGDVSLWPEIGVNFPVAVAKQDVAGRDDLLQMNKNGDGKTDLMNATRNVGNSGRVTLARENLQCSGKTADNDETELFLPVNASLVISEAVLLMAQMQQDANGVECIKTTRVNIPAMDASAFLQLQVPTDMMKSTEQQEQKSKPTMPLLLMGAAITSSSTSKEIRLTAFDAKPSNKGGSDCSEEKDAKGECITEQGVDGEPDCQVCQDGASVDSYHSRDEAASDVTILFDASSDADVSGTQENSNGSSNLVSNERLEKRMNVIEAPWRSATKEDGAKEGSLAKTIVFDIHENGSKSGNPSDDNRQSSTIPYSSDGHSPSRVSPDVILLDDESSTKSLSPKKNNSVNRGSVSHGQQPTDCLPSAKDTLSAIIGHDESHLVDRFGHENETGLNGRAITRADVIGEPSGLFESELRHCTTIPASDSGSSDDGTDQMFSKTKPSDNRKIATCNKRTLSNLSVKNLSRFNSLQAASSSNLNPISQSSDYMLERYLTTLVKNAISPAVPTGPSGEGRELARSSRVKAGAECLSSIQNVMLTSMSAAWKGLFESGNGGDVTVYTMESSFAVHAFVLQVRCPTLLKETHGRVQSESIEGRISSEDISGKTRSLFWKNISHEASRNFFLYIYCGCCDWKLNEPAVVREVLSLASKYEREDLVQFCQATAVLRKPGHQTGNSLVQTHECDSEKDTPLIVSFDGELKNSSSFRRQTTPVNVTPVTADKSKDRAVHSNDTRRSLMFSPSFRADQDISLPSLDFGEKKSLGPTKKSNIGPGLSPDQKTTNMSKSRASHRDAGCLATTVDKLTKAYAPTPIDISKLLEGKLCGMIGSVSQTPCTNRSHEKQSMHYKSLATVRSLSPDLFSDCDEEPFDESAHSLGRNRNCVDQSLISEREKMQHSGHSSQSKILQNLSHHSTGSNKISPNMDVRLRLSSVDTSNLTIEDGPGNDNTKLTNNSIKLHDALNLCHITSENNHISPSKTVDQNDIGNVVKMNIISNSAVHCENIIDISQSDSDASRESSNTTLTSVHQPPNALAPLSPRKIGINLPCGKSPAKGCSTTAELYNKTTDAESEAGQTGVAYVSNVWYDFEDLGCCQDDGGPLTAEKTSCDSDDQTKSCKKSENLIQQTNMSDNRPKLCEGRRYGLNSTVVEADKNKILNLSSACQNISRISIGEAALQRQSECFRAVTICHTALDSYSSPKAGHASINSHPDTGDLHSNSLVRKMFSNDSLMQLQEELQKEWDEEELELSTGINDTSLRSRLSNKRKRDDDFCVQQSSKRKRKCRTPTKRKTDDTRHPLISKSHRPGTKNLITNTNILRNDTKRPRDVSSSKVLSNKDFGNELPDVTGSPAVRNAARGVGALPHRVQQLQSRRASIASHSKAAFSPNCSAADSSLAITPKPDFSTMPTPDLKQRLQQFGIRPLSRPKARALLQHIYEQTHPVVSASSPSCARGSDRLQSPVGGIGSCESGPSVIALRASTPVGRSRAGAAWRATGKKTQAWTPRHRVAVAATAGNGQRVAPRAKTGCQMLEEPKHEERRMTHEAHATDISSTNTAKLVDLSQSGGEEDSSSVGCDEESMLLQLPEENPSTTSDIESVHEQLRALIVSDVSLHRAVLLYQPLWLHHFKDAAFNAGIRCTAAALVDFLDQQCITFRMGSSAGTGRTRTRLKKLHKKRGGVA